MTRERSIRGSADTNQLGPRTRDLCAPRPHPAQRSAIHGADHRRGARGEKGSQRGRMARPWAPQPAPWRHHHAQGPVLSPRWARGRPDRGGLRRSCAYPPGSPLRAGMVRPRWGGAPGQPLPTGDRLLRRVVVAQRGRGGGGAWAPSLPRTGRKARSETGAGHAGPGERAGATSIAVAASLSAPSSPLEGSGWRKTREAGG